MSTRKTPRKVDYKVLETEIDKYLKTSSKTVQVMMRRLEEAPEMTPMEKEFAIRYVTKVQTYQKWADEFNCSYNTIQKMMNNPKVKELIDQLKYDIRTYAMAGLTVAFRKSIEQIVAILDMPNLLDTLEIKSKVALKLLEFYSPSKKGGDDEDNDMRKRFNVNIFTGSVAKQGETVPEAEGVSVEVVEEQQAELDELQKNAEIIKQMQEAIDEDE